MGKDKDGWWVPFEDEKKDALFDEIVQACRWMETYRDEAMLHLEEDHIALQNIEDHIRKLQLLTTKFVNLIEDLE